MTLGRRTRPRPTPARCPRAGKSSTRGARDGAVRGRIYPSPARVRFLTIPVTQTQPNHSMPGATRTWLRPTPRLGGSSALPPRAQQLVNPARQPDRVPPEPSFRAASNACCQARLPGRHPNTFRRMAGARGEPDRDRRDVNAERGHPAVDHRDRQPSQPAAGVQHGPGTTGDSSPTSGGAPPLDGQPDPLTAT